MIAATASCSTTSGTFADQRVAYLVRCWAAGHWRAFPVSKPARRSRFAMALTGILMDNLPLIVRTSGIHLLLSIPGRRRLLRRCVLADLQIPTLPTPA